MTKSMTAAISGLVLMWIQAAPAAAPRTGTCVDSPQAVLTVCVAADSRGPYYDVYRAPAEVRVTVFRDVDLGSLGVVQVPAAVIGFAIPGVTPGV